jgi:two-component system, sporulation sensor kinase A
MANKFDEIYKELVTHNTESPKSEGYKFEFDLKGNFLSITPEAAQFAGYGIEALETMSVWDVISEKDHDLMLEKFAARKEGRPVDPYEVTLIKRTGEQVKIKVQTTPIVEAGKVVRIKGVFLPR